MNSSSYANKMLREQLAAGASYGAGSVILATRAAETSAPAAPAAAIPAGADR